MFSSASLEVSKTDSGTHGKGGEGDATLGHATIAPAALIRTILFGLSANTSFEETKIPIADEKIIANTKNAAANCRLAFDVM